MKRKRERTGGVKETGARDSSIMNSNYNRDPTVDIKDTYTHTYIPCQITSLLVASSSSPSFSSCTDFNQIFSRYNNHNNVRIIKKERVRELTYKSRRVLPFEQNHTSSSVSTINQITNCKIEVVRTVSLHRGCQNLQKKKCCRSYLQLIPKIRAHIQRDIS